MKIVVQKFGGSSVATMDKLKAVAKKIVDTKREGYGVVAVVSAMGNTTDELLELARQASPDPSRRELDMLLSVGERISMALLSVAIHSLGEEAISLTGSQCGIITTHSHSNARIIDVRPFRVQDELEAGNIVIVAGFQGTSYKREVTTLGRGGSDTTAVALAAALGAERCDIYSDVDGIYNADPRVVEDAQRLAEISYEEMQELARQGARVLHSRAVEFARAKQIAIYARSTFEDGGGTVVKRVDGAIEDGLAHLAVSGVAGRKGLMAVAYESTGTGDNRSADVLDELSDVDILFANANPMMDRLDVLVSTNGVGDPTELARRIRKHFSGTVTTTTELGSAAVVGLGIGDRPDAMLTALRVLRKAKIPVVLAYSSRESVACVVREKKVDDAVRVLHAAFLGDAD